MNKRAPTKCGKPAWPQRDNPPGQKPLTARLPLFLPQHPARQALPGFSKLPPRNLTRLLLAQPVDLQQNLQSPLIRDRDPSPFSLSIAVCLLLVVAPCRGRPEAHLFHPSSYRPPGPPLSVQNIPSLPPETPDHRFAGASRLPRNIDRFIRHRLPLSFAPAETPFSGFPHPIPSPSHPTPLGPARFRNCPVVCSPR